MSDTGGLNSCCLSGHLHTGEPVGKEEKVGELDCYVSPSPDGSKKKVIIYLTDVFGWKFNNARLLADQYAKHAGAYVYMPHFFVTDPLPAEDVKILEPNLDDREKLSIADKAKNAAYIATTMGPFVASNREAVVLPKINAFVEHIRTDPAVGKIGAVGFCFGGRYAVLMAHENSKVDAAVANHPALLGFPTDLDNVTKPLSIALGDQDSHVPKAQIDQIIDIMEKKLDLDKEIVIYPGQIHGFAVRGDQTSEETKEAMDKVLRQTVAWFNKYLV